MKNLKSWFAFSLSERLIGHIISKEDEAKEKNVGIYFNF